MSKSIRTLSTDINEANITLSADQLFGLHQTLVKNMDQGKRIGDVFGYTLNTILYKEFSKADSKPGRTTSVKVTPQMASAINQILDAKADDLLISKDDESYIRSKVSRLVENFEMINEGMFSWKTQDTDMAISAYRDGRQTVYMIDDKGNVWEEDAYEGYGEFGGKDYYELLDQMNGGPGDRKNGIDLAFGPLERKDGKPVLFPALVHDKKYNWKRHDFTKEAKSDPKQGMPAKKYWTGSRPQYEAMKTNTSIITEDFKDVSDKFKEALDDLADSKFNDKDIEALIKKYKEKRPDAAMAYAKKAFGWLWKESVDVNEARSIPKIQKEWGKIVDDMRGTVVSWKAAEGQEKEDLLAKLKDLTAQKKKLEAELNDAVGLKDADAELVGEAAVNELSIGTYRDTVKAGIARGDSKGEKIANRALESFAREVLKELASQEFIIKASRNQAVSVADQIRRGDNKNQFNQFKLVFTGEGSMINNKNIRVFGSDEVHFNAKAYIYLPDTFGGWSSDFTLRGYQQHNHVPLQTVQFSIKNGNVYVYFRAGDAEFEFTRPGARMLAQLADIIAQELEFPTKVKHNAVKQFDAMPVRSNESAQFVSESYDELNERVVTLKRKYTESHPARTAGSHASVRNKMLEAIADGKLTKEEFNAILKETSKNSAKWLRKNALYFNVSEEGITLSKFGKRALSQIRINEATDMKLFESFEQFVASSKLDEAKETWVVYTKPKNNPLRMDFYSDHTSKKSAEDMIELLSTKVRNNKWDGFGMMPRSDWDKMVGDKYAFEGNLYEAYVELDAMDPESKDLQKFLKKHNVELEIIDMGGPDYGAYWVRLEGKKRDLEIVLADDEFGWDMDKRDMEIEEAINWDTIELNESLKSSKLSALLDLRGMSKQVMKGIYGFTKAKLSEITDDQLVELTPQEAYKSKRPNALFFYIVDNEKENPYADRDAWRETKVIPGNTLIAVADGNNKFYGVDYGSRWGKDRQLTLSTKDSDGIGVNKKYRGYDASGLYNVKRIADVADRVLVFDWSLMPSASEERMERSAAKKGAIAFMTDKDFKAQNMARYKEILGQKAAKLPLDKIVEDAINEITKQIADGIKANNLTRYGELILGTSSNGREVNTRDASNAMGNILNAYSNYVRSSVEVESAKKNGWSGEYDQRNMQDNAKTITELVKKIKTMDYGW